MNLKRRKASRIIAALLLLSIAQIGLQIGLAEPNSANTVTPVPQQFIARLRTRDNRPIQVNGLGAATGASILSGATIETAADQSATVNLGPLGSLDIAPDTKLVLTFDDQRNVKVVLVFGCAILTANRGTTGELATEQSSISKTEPASGGVIETCFPQGAAAPTVGPGVASGAGAGAGGSTTVAGGGGLFGLGVPATIAIIGGATAAGLTPLFFQNNPSGPNN